MRHNLIDQAKLVVTEVPVETTEIELGSAPSVELEAPGDDLSPGDLTENKKPDSEFATLVEEEARDDSIHSGLFHGSLAVRLAQQIVTGDALAITPLTCHGAELPGRLERLAEQGITDVAFQPMGDIDRELRAFAAAARI